LIQYHFTFNTSKGWEWNANGCLQNFSKGRKNFPEGKKTFLLPKNIKNITFFSKNISKHTTGSLGFIIRLFDYSCMRKPRLARGKCKISHIWTLNTDFGTRFEIYIERNVEKLYFFTFRAPLAVHVEMPLKLRCDKRFTNAFTACGCIFKEITLAQTKVITLKTQLHAVNARWKRLSPLSFKFWVCKSVTWHFHDNFFSVLKGIW